MGWKTGVTLAWSPRGHLSNHAKEATSGPHPPFKSRRSCVGQELLELVQQVRGTIEQNGNLFIHALDRALLLLIRLQDLQELLIRIRVRGEPILDFVNIVDGMVEFDGSLAILGIDRRVLLWWRRRSSHKRSGNPGWTIRVLHST